jgi:hypothetical protein
MKNNKLNSLFIRAELAGTRLRRFHPEAANPCSWNANSFETQKACEFLKRVGGQELMMDYLADLNALMQAQ